MSEGSYILIARDCAEALAGLDEALVQEGYTVFGVRDGTTLLSFVASQNPDLVLIDESVQEVAPLEVVRHAQSRASIRDIPFVYLSSQACGDEAANAIRAGVVDYIRKPFELREVLARIASHVERGRLIRDARRDAESSSIVLDVLHDVTGSLSSEEIFDILVHRVSRLFRVRRCSMILVDESRVSGTVVATHDDPSISALALDLRRYPEICQAIETGSPVLVRNLRNSALFEQIRAIWEREKIDIDVKSVLAIPFDYDHGRSGVFFLRSIADEPALDEESVKLTSAIAQAAVKALHRAALFESVVSQQEQFETMAKTDELTGCLSRRHLMERLQNELERAARYKRDLGLVMFDIDDFKSLNDTHGHTTGDAALRCIGEVLQHSLRTADFVGRYGGDEFLLVLPETSVEGTHQLAERIRMGVSGREFDLRAGAMRLSISGGIVGYPTGGVATLEDLIDRADQALYQAKAAGRNRVLVHESVARASTDGGR